MAEFHKSRLCYLYISARNKEILFVPYGKVNNGISAEIDDIIVDSWPCDFKNLQENINATLNKFQNSITYEQGVWPSFRKSKAKSQSSYHHDYIAIRLSTDNSRDYGNGEVERIEISVKPSELDNYQLKGTTHLIDTAVAQLVIDIYTAC